MFPSGAPYTFEPEIVVRTISTLAASILPLAAEYALWFTRNTIELAPNVGLALTLNQPRVTVNWLLLSTESTRMVSTLAFE